METRIDERYLPEGFLPSIYQHVAIMMDWSHSSPTLELMGTNHATTNEPEPHTKVTRKAIYQHRKIGVRICILATSRSSRWDASTWQGGLRWCQTSRARWASQDAPICTKEKHSRVANEKAIILLIAIRILKMDVTANQRNIIYKSMEYQGHHGKTIWWQKTSNFSYSHKSMPYQGHHGKSGDR